MREGSTVRNKSRLAGRAAAGALVFGALVAGAAGAAAQDDERIRWKLGSAYSSQTDLLGPTGVQTAEKIEEITGGDFRLQRFEPGALVPPLELIDAVGQGAVEAARTAPGLHTGKEPAFVLFASIPFGPDAVEHAAWLLHGGGMELYNELLEPFGVYSMPCGMIAAQGSGWFREPVEEVSDLQGKKMRVYGFAGQIFQKLGVSPQLLAPGDIYPALERGVLDAAELGMPSIDETLGFHQIAKSYDMPGWHEPYSVTELLINRDLREQLPERYKTLVRTVCRSNLIDEVALANVKWAEPLQRLEEKGVQVCTWPDEIMDRFRQGWQEVAAEQSEKDPVFKRVWDHLGAFREGYAEREELGYAYEE